MLEKRPEEISLMWLSDSGSGFGKIVKCQTDLQKKCQKGLHNDKKFSEIPYKQGISEQIKFYLITK